MKLCQARTQVVRRGSSVGFVLYILDAVDVVAVGHRKDDAAKFLNLEAIRANFLVARLGGRAGSYTVWGS